MKFTFPWDCLLHDNHRLMPAMVKTKRGKVARLITSPGYRMAKQFAEIHAKQQYKGSALNGEIVLVAKVFMPDLRKRDAGNYRKLINDALSDIAYGDDSQLVDERWIKGGIDRKNPRCEVEVKQITPTEI